MNELALFAGAGGGLLATHHLLGWRCVGYVEMAKYPCRVLEARIKDGLLSKAPIFQMHTRDFIRLGLAEKYRGVADVVTAGFPCQPFAIGGERRGADDERNAWPDTIRIIREVKPQWVFLENSPNLLSVQHRGATPPYIQQIVGELASSGYVGRWGCLSASTLGADHKRKRVWIVAHATGTGREIILRNYAERSLAPYQRLPKTTTPLDAIWNRLSQLEKRLGEPSVLRDNDGLAYQMDRLAAAGEGQVPAVVAEVWRLLRGEINE